MLRAVRHLARDRRANVAMMFAICAPFCLAFSGLGIDFAIKENVRRALQNAVDAAVLAAARVESESDRAAIADQFAADNFASAHGGHDLALALSEDPDTGDLVGEARITIPNAFGRLFGIDESTIKATAAVRTNAPPLEVMLVLDKTASMAGAKLDALKASASTLIESMMDGVQVKVGIVPFAQYVNIGMELRHEPGFSIPDDYSVCEMRDIPHYSNPHDCRLIETTCWNDGGSYPCSWTHCDYDVTFTRERVCDEYAWRGCVGSREEPLNARDESTGTPVPGLLNVWCGQPLLRLTLDKSKALDRIRSLSADGYTYIPSGLMMGWHALSYRPILPDGSDPDDPEGRYMKRAIVLMTDGANTASKDRGAPTHWSNDVNKANNVTRELCRNIADDGIMIYTVAFDVTDPDILAILRNCATDPSAAFTAEDSAELAAAFTSIGRSLSRLRLAR